MIGLVVDEVAAQKERMTLGERQTETKTFGEVVDFDSYSLKKLISLNKTLEIGQEIKKNKTIVCFVWAHNKFFIKKLSKSLGFIKKGCNFATVILKTIFLP